MNHNLALDFPEGRTRTRPVIVAAVIVAAVIVAATQICHHELRPAAAATRHLAAPKEHRHVTLPLQAAVVTHCKLSVTISLSFLSIEDSYC